MSYKNLKKLILEKFPQIKIIEDFDTVKEPCCIRGFATSMLQFAYLEEFDINIPIYTIGEYSREDLAKNIIKDIEACWLQCNTKTKIFLFLSNVDYYECKWGDTWYSCDIGVCTA